MTLYIVDEKKLEKYSKDELLSIVKQINKLAERQTAYEPALLIRNHNGWTPIGVDGAWSDQIKSILLKE